MTDSVKCRNCSKSADDLLTVGDLGDALLVGKIGYCLECCPDDRLQEATELMKQRDQKHYSSGHTKT